MASFTVRLINNEVRGEFSSVDEVLDANEKVCVVVYVFCIMGCDL